MSLFSRKPDRVPEAAEALAGRDHPSFDIPAEHDVLAGKPLVPPFPDGIDWLLVGMGCFWGAERVFWQTPGVWTTSVGYAGGTTPNPTYREVCSGRTGHAEVVLVAYDPSVIRPPRCCASSGRATTRPRACGRATTPGTQYRSAIYWRTPEQRDAAIATRDAYAAALAERGKGPITTEIAEAGAYYPAEDYHQQYLHKNPAGYCGIGGTGVSCPIGAGATAA